MLKLWKGSTKLAQSINIFGIRIVSAEGRASVEVYLSGVDRGLGPHRNIGKNIVFKLLECKNRFFGQNSQFTRSASQANVYIEIEIL